MSKVASPPSETMLSADEYIRVLKEAPASPTYLVIGAMKCGTTRLAYLLGQHPQVHMAPAKELQLLAHEAVAEPFLRWYIEQYAGSENSVARGEASVFYSKCLTYPGTAQRIHEYVPHAKIIYLVRHPLAQLESNWMEYRAIGLKAHRSFNISIRSSTEIFEDALYWTQISQYRELFPDSQILVIPAERLSADEPATLRRVLEFIGADPALAPTSVNGNEKRNSWVGKREPRIWYEWVMANRAARLLRGWMPDRVVHVARRIGTSRIQNRPTWEPEVRDWAISQLRPQADAILDYVGEKRDYWKF